MFLYSLLSLTVLSVIGISYFVCFILYQNHNRDLSVTKAFIFIISQFAGAWCVILWIIYGVYRGIIFLL